MLILFAFAHVTSNKLIEETRKYESGNPVDSLAVLSFSIFIIPQSFMSSDENEKVVSTEYQDVLCFHGQERLKRAFDPL